MSSLMQVNIYRSSKCSHIPSYHIKKSCFLIAPLISSEMCVLHNWQAHGGRHKFFKSLIFALYFPTGNMHYQFSLKQWAHCVHFKKMSANIQAWTTIVCQPYFQVQMAFHKKGASSIGNSKSPKCFFSKQQP